MTSENIPGYIEWSYIEPRTLKQKKQVEVYVKKLKITLPQELFTLKCILSLDWNRRVIISYIEKIKREKSLGMTKFIFTLTAPSASLNYVLSNPYIEEGWAEGYETFEERAWHCYYTLSNYCRT